MTENGTVAASENSGHPSAFIADFRPPHRKNASTQLVKQALLNAVSDGVPPEAKRLKLLPSHYPVLTAHQRPCFSRLVS